MNNTQVLLDIKFNIANKIAAFAEELPGRTLINYQAGELDGTDPDAIRYAVVWKPTPGVLASLPNLEVIFSLGAGVDHVFADPDLPDLPIVRFVDPDLTGRMVEYVVLQVLMHLRQQRAYDAQQRKRNWAERPQPAAQDLRVGILGLGELGQACAKALHVLGFPLNGWSRSPKAVDGVSSYHGDDQLATFLGETDVLVNLLPLTDATTGIINADLIAKLATDGPFGAPVIINAGRGGSQIETDIIAALDSGALHGASLDVFETEPLDADSRLWGYDNVIVTPHMAATSDAKALARHVGEQVRRYESCQPLQYVVDRGQGY